MSSQRGRHLCFCFAKKQKNIFSSVHASGKKALLNRNAPIPLCFGHSFSKNQGIQKRIYLKSSRITPGTRAAQNPSPSAEVTRTTRNPIPKKTSYSSTKCEE